MSIEKKFENVNLTIDDALASIQLNRPDKKNAMSPDLHRDMHSALDEIEKQGGVKVIVITGAGKCFCAGMDLELRLGSHVSFLRAGVVVWAMARFRIA